MYSFFIDSKKFEAWLEEVCKALPPKSCLVMDNASYHSKLVSSMYHKLGNSSSTFQFTTDLGSLIWNFDCGYSTVWEFSDFSGTLILREFNCEDSRSAKSAIFAILRAVDFVH